MDFIKYFLYKYQLLNGSIVDFWCELAMIIAENDGKNSISNRIQALNFLCDMWVAFPLYLEETMKITNLILDKLKKASRDHC